jgi:dTDP-4-amino-4,6-dideoxygalactose transaminase
MTVTFVDLKLQYARLKSEVDSSINAILSGGNYIGGQAVAQFEKAFADQLKVPHVIGVGNGTDAIFIALKSVGIGAGDEVITPAWSWISSAETITLAGARPVFADVDEYFTLDVNDLVRKISSRTKAVVAVNLYGQAADLSRIRALCDQHKLFLIEDCAQAHFSSLKGKLAGTWGDINAFSFYPTKNLGAYGDAGAVVTASSVLAEKARRYANHGGLTKNDHAFEGINSRLDPIQAAVLTVKLKYIHQWNASRLENARFYSQQLVGIGDLILPMVRPDSNPTFHLYVICSRHRESLRQYLLERGIETQIHYPTALPFEPAYQHLAHNVSDFPRAFQLQSEVLSLPIYPELEKAQLQYVCDQIKSFFK